MSGPPDGSPSSRSATGPSTPPPSMPDDDFEPPDRPPAVPEGALEAHPALELHRAHLRRDPPTREGDRTAARRAELPLARLGGARPGVSGLAWRGDDAGDHPVARRSPASAPRTTTFNRTDLRPRQRGAGRHSRRVTSATRNRVRQLLHRQRDATSLAPEAFRGQHGRTACAGRVEMSSRVASTRPSITHPQPAVRGTFHFDGSHNGRMGSLQFSTRIEESGSGDVRTILGALPHWFGCLTPSWITLRSPIDHLR